MDKIYNHEKVNVAVQKTAEVLDPFPHVQKAVQKYEDAKPAMKKVLEPRDAKGARVRRVDHWLERMHEKHPRCMSLPFVNYLLPTHITYDGPNIKDYDEQRVENFSWIYIWKSTAISKVITFEVIALTALCSVLGYYDCASPDETLVVGYTQPGAICFPFPSDTKALTLSSVAAFLLTSFFSRTIERWRRIKTKNGKIGSASLQIMQLCYTYIRPMPGDTFHSEMARLLELGQRFVFKEVNKDKDYSDLIEEGLLTAEEAVEMKAEAGPKFQMFHVPYMWISALVRDMAFADRIPPQMPGMLQTLQELVWKAHSSARSVRGEINTPFPYAYYHMLVFSAHMYLIQVFFVSCGLLGKSFQSGDYSWMFIGYLTLVMNVTIYRGVIRINHMLRNPYGEGSSDFPKLGSIKSLQRSMKCWEKAADARWKVSPYDPLAVAPEAADEPAAASVGKSYTNGQPSVIVPVGENSVVVDIGGPSEVALARKNN